MPEAEDHSHGLKNENREAWPPQPCRCRALAAATQGCRTECSR